MSGKFRYKCNFCYLAVLLDILLIYSAGGIYLIIILLLAGIISFIYFLNAKGEFKLPEDEEEFEISGFFWSHSVSYENVMKVSVEKIYRKVFTGIYYKDTVKKIRLRIETDDRVIIFDAKDIDAEDNHCFYKLCNYINRRVSENYAKSVDMMKNA